MIHGNWTWGEHEAVCKGRDPCHRRPRHWVFVVDCNCCRDEDFEQSGNKKTITDTSALVTMWMQCVGNTLLEHQQVDARCLGGGAAALDGGGVIFQRNWPSRHPIHTHTHFRLRAFLQKHTHIVTKRPVIVSGESRVPEDLKREHPFPSLPFPNCSMISCHVHSSRVPDLL